MQFTMSKYMFSRSSLFAWLIATGIVLAGPAAASETDPPDDATAEADDSDDDDEPPADGKKKSIFDDVNFQSDSSDWPDPGTEAKYPRIEHHGYFRFRADMFSNMDLGTGSVYSNSGRLPGSSGFLPPLTENFINNTSGAAYPANVVGKDVDEAFLASANMRFRYQPTFHINRQWKFTATFDVLDNIVLGSTPDSHPNRPDTPLVAFAGGQAPPSNSASSQFTDNVRVKELWGQWNTPLLGMPIMFGRMSSHWGLGILANGGNDWDADFGDYNDRVMAVLGFGEAHRIYISGGYDIVSSGPTYKQQYQPFGQAYDITETDDVQQGFLAVFHRAVTKEDKKKERELLDAHKPVFDWGAYAVYRKQELDITSETRRNLQEFNFESSDLIKREAWAVIPDLWMRLQYHPARGMKLRVELEGTMIYGKIERVQDGDKPPERTLTSWGVALEAEFKLHALGFQLYAGAASGDDSDYLTVLDRSNFADTNAGTSNTTISNFRFDRGYNIDMILFREVIGTVTNAWYTKAAVSYDLYGGGQEETGIFGELSVMVAGALEKDAYPGDAAFLGTEINAKIFMEDKGKFYADLAFGLFIPGAAFDTKSGSNGWPDNVDGVEAEVAWTLQTHIVLKY
ncbi:MAG: hypothetical protein ACI9OJ_002708 [Myxococcota bacterium]